MALIIKARSLRPSDKLILKSVCNQLPSGSRDIFSNEIYKKLEFSTEKEIETAKTHILKKTWEGNHLLEYFKFIVDTIPKADLEEVLYQYEFARTGNEFVKFNDIKNQFSTGFGGKKPKKLFFVIATAYEVSVLKCLVQFLEFCLDKNRPLQYFYTDKNSFDRYVEAANKILQANKNKTKNTFDLSALTLLKEDRLKLEAYINDVKKYLEKNPEKGRPKADFEGGLNSNDIDENASPNLSPTSASSIQPQLTIPQAQENNSNYFANTVIKKVIGRTDQEKRLEAFLKCKLNVAWFQLAGVAGQGKSRLAFDLMRKASSLGWHAGFLEKDDIEYFEDHWKNWQPDKPHLFIIDYVIGREQEIISILKILLPNRGKSPCNIRKFQHDIRILLVERQRWDQGSPIQILDQDNKDDSKLPANTGDKAEWFLRLCGKRNFETRLKPSCFENGVEELKELDEDDLVTIVKQIFTGKELAISDYELKKTLKRIDNLGRPLYAYLLVQQLSDSQEGYQRWTNTDLLYYQLMRDRERWKHAFERNAPIFGDNHPAMKLAVLATMVREVGFQDSQIKQYFGNIDSPLGKEAIPITGGYLIPDNKRPYTINALKPDLLGEWFVLYCFHEGLEFEGLLDIAWQYSPSETAIFLHRVTEDFIDSSEKYNNWNIIEKLLAHKSVHENHYQALASVAVSIAHILYSRKLAIPQTIIEALEHAADLFDTNAMNSLGVLYIQGLSVSRHTKKACKLFQQAIDRGSNSRAMVNLGLCYEKGKGVTQDKNEAVKLYRSAVKLGDSQAMVNLGICYATGEGVEQDKNEAIKLYRRAVELGDSHAMFNLAICYQKGAGVWQNWNEAIDLFQRAVKLGDSRAMVSLGVCYQKGDGIEQDKNEAIKLYRRAVELGDRHAMFNLGLCYQNGEGVTQNWDEAVKLYRRAVELGSSQAMYNLGVCYKKGKGISQDWSEAFKLYKRAVELGYNQAMNNLGICYKYGEGVKQDNSEAIKLFRRAVELGNSHAMVNLGLCYQNGQGIEQDLNMAINLYQCAVRAGEKRAIDYSQNILLLQNFVGDSAYKTREIKTWPNIKRPRLTEAPVFDPPITGGDWKQFSTKKVAACFDKVLTSFEILELIGRLDGYSGQYARRLPLSFYKDCDLVDIQLYNPSNKNTLIFSAIFNDENAILLNGSSNILEGLNAYLLAFDSQKAIFDYSQFNCSYVYGNNGPSQIISNLNEIPFSKEANQHIQNAIKESFFSPRYIEGNFEREGWQQFEAFVLYRGFLTVATFKVFPDGIISMENDKPIPNKPHILQRQYDGVFRTSLRSLHY